MYYVTVEEPVRAEVLVEHRHTVVAPFAPKSLARSIREAAPWQTRDQVRRVVDAVHQALEDDDSRAPTPKARIVELTLRQLQRLDVAAHVRFALQHLGRTDRERPGFERATDLRRWLKDEYPLLAEAAVPSRLGEVVHGPTGTRKRFDVDILEKDVIQICKGRGTPEQVQRLCDSIVRDVVDALGDQPLVTTGQITAELLRSLRRRDDLAYLRYVGVEKQLATALDFEAEALALEALRQWQTSSARESTASGWQDYA